MNQQRNMQEGVGGDVERARAAAARGDWPGAGKLLRAILKTTPDDVEALLGLSAVHMASSRTGDAIACVRRAIEADPDQARLWLALGELLFADADGPGAIDACRRAAELDPRGTTALSALAGVLERTGDLDGALETVAMGLEREPGSHELRLLKGKLLRQAGRADESLELLESVDPGALPPPMQIASAFELALTREKLGQYEGAFESFVRGNERARVLRRLDQRPPSPVFRTCELTKRIPRETFRAWREAGPVDSKRAPVMLVGFPRSGTTLSGQILSAHPGLHVLEERPMLRDVIAAFRSCAPAGADLVGALDGLSRVHLTKIRAAYFSELRAQLPRERWDEHERGELGVVHKMPMDIAELALISRVFPDVKLIVVLRDPRDACLSCFKQDFQINDTTRYFTSLESTVRMYNAAMGCWESVRDRLAIDKHELRYESLAGAFEHEARELVSFLGLEWQDAVLRFHESEHRRFITTPSYEAVTSPVNARAIGGWKRYAEMVREAFAPLDPLVRAFGYPE